MAALFADLVRDLTGLIRNEIALARTELADKADRVTSGVMFLVLGALVFFAVLIAVLRVIVLGLAVVMGEAAAGGLVGGGVFILGGLLIWWGRHALRARSLAPRRTLNSLSHKETTR